MSLRPGAGPRGLEISVPLGQAGVRKKTLHLPSASLLLGKACGQPSFVLTIILVLTDQILQLLNLSQELHRVTTCAHVWLSSCWSESPNFSLHSLLYTEIPLRRYFHVKGGGPAKQVEEHV